MATRRRGSVGVPGGRYDQLRSVAARSRDAHGALDRSDLPAGVRPKLQSVGQVCTFLRWQRGFPIPSSAAFGKIGEAYVAGDRPLATAQRIPVVHFKKGENKEAHRAPVDGRRRPAGRRRPRRADRGCAGEGIRLAVLEGEGTGARAHPHMEWGRQMAYINHYYFYLWDPEWGPAFWKTNAYAPFPIWLWLNGHEWAKRQLEKAGIAYEALDNGFRSCADPETLQRSATSSARARCRTSSGAGCHRLPSPFTKGICARGYGTTWRFASSKSPTPCVFDRPQAGRAWFEGVIRDHLDIGRPEQVVPHLRSELINTHPGRVPHPGDRRGVDPILTCFYKSSRLKQYFKEGRAPAYRTGHLRHARLRDRGDASAWSNRQFSTSRCQMSGKHRLLVGSSST